jgi:hypothetical protein
MVRQKETVVGVVGGANERRQHKGQLAKVTPANTGVRGEPDEPLQVVGKRALGFRLFLIVNFFVKI